MKDWRRNGREEQAPGPGTQNAIPPGECGGDIVSKLKRLLPARLELAIFGWLLESRFTTLYETDALPTEPRKLKPSRIFANPIHLSWELPFFLAGRGHQASRGTVNVWKISD